MQKYRATIQRVVYYKDTITVTAADIYEAEEKAEKAIQNMPMDGSTLDDMEDYVSVEEEDDDDGITDNIEDFEEKFKIGTKYL